MSQPKGPQKTIALDAQGNPVPSAGPAPAPAPAPGGGAANNGPSTVMMEAPAAAAMAAAHRANAERAQRNQPQSGGGGGVGKWIGGFFLMLVSAAGTAGAAHFALPLKPKVVAPPPKQIGKVKLVTEPEGATISVDGKNVPRFTPTTVEGEVGATLKVVLKLDGYKTKEVDVVVASAEENPFNTTLEKEEKVAAAPAGGDTKTAADTKPADTKAADGKTDSKDAKDTKPADTKAADAKPADTKASDTKSKDTKAADTKATDTKVATAKPDKKDSGSSSSSSSSTSSKKTEKAATPAPGGSQGTVSIFVRPWAIVFVDGRRIRQTPIQAYGLSAGKHTLELQNDTKGKREKIQINVEAGASQEIRRDWDN